MLKRGLTRKQVLIVALMLVFSCGVIAGYTAVPRSSRGIYVIGIVALYLVGQGALTAASIRHSKRRP
ncbi:MAG: hypothetical protein JWO21_902 [Solirubrobacterales bacterium]|jgi:hypothetical protein|nr:hypothetical protein [Solirubrobacterales bacterium]